MNISWDKIKEKLGEEAVRQFIPNHGDIGLGSGSTSMCFIKTLGKKNTQESQYTCIPSSEAARKAAEKEGLTVISSNDWDRSIDVTCDGADYIDIITGAAIKGLGGALLREKIVAQASKKFIIMVDQRKVIPHDVSISLTIPVEIAQFGAYRTQKQIQETLSSHFANTTCSFRQDGNQAHFITDNGNYIIDIALIAKSTELSFIDALLNSVTGVLETGIFISLATDILIGLDNGDIQHRAILRK